MRNLFFFLLVFILTGFVSCNKPQGNDPDPIPIDTIFPLPYYPVYPGSYWKYIDSFGDTTVIMTDPEYRKDWYKMEEKLDPDTAYVPFCDGIGIWGYKAHTGEDLNQFCFTRILSDSLPVWADWNISHVQLEVYEYYDERRQIIARDTSIEISGRIYFPTIIINEYFIHSDVYGRKIYERCYTKGIGLVKEEVFNNFGQLVNTKILLEYYINYNK
jgi:hypothetical protein